MDFGKTWRKSRLKAGIICGLATAVLSVGAVGCMVGGAVFSWRGSLDEAKAFDNYRLEELQKAQEMLDDGEISQSQFDVRVSYINGMEDLSVYRNFCVDEGHQDCCEQLYVNGIKQSAAGVAMIFVGVAAAFGAAIAGHCALDDLKDSKHF